MNLFAHLECQNEIVARILKNTFAFIIDVFWIRSFFVYVAHILVSINNVLNAIFIHILHSVAEYAKNGYILWYIELS